MQLTNTIRNYKWNTIAIAILIALILPWKDLFLGFAQTINNDGYNHWLVFEAIKTGNAQFLYFGQMITGYSLVWIEKITGINLITSLMWFSYFTLVIGGIICMILITNVTKSRLAGILSAFVMTFGTGAVVHLFWSGTVFNLVEMIILFPFALLMIFNFTMKKTWINSIWMILSISILLIYHPTFGIQTASSMGNIIQPMQSPLRTNFDMIKEGYQNPLFTLFYMIGIANFTALIICVKSLWEKKLPISTGVIFWICSNFAIIFGALAFTGWTAFSPRLAMNFAIVINLITCLLAGIVIRERLKSSWIVITLLIVGIMPNLVMWIGKY